MPEVSLPFYLDDTTEKTVAEIQEDKILKIKYIYVINLSGSQATIKLADGSTSSNSDLINVIVLASNDYDELTPRDSPIRVLNKLTAITSSAPVFGIVTGVVESVER